MPMTLLWFYYSSLLFLFNLNFKMNINRQKYIKLYLNIKLINSHTPDVSYSNFFKIVVPPVPILISYPYPCQCPCNLGYWLMVVGMRLMFVVVRADLWIWVFGWLW